MNIPITVYEIVSEAFAFDVMSNDEQGCALRLNPRTTCMVVSTCVGPIWESGQYVLVLTRDGAFVATSAPWTIHEVTARGGAKVDVKLRSMIVECGTLRCYRAGDVPQESSSP